MREGHEKLIFGKKSDRGEEKYCIQWPYALSDYIYRVGGGGRRGGGVFAITEQSSSSNVIPIDGFVALL